MTRVHAFPRNWALASHPILKSEATYSLSWTARRLVLFPQSRALFGGSIRTRHSAETQGGYLWSPKRNQGEGFNTLYDNMRGVGKDTFCSFCDTLIRAVGIAHGNCYECPKPAEFGSTGRNWSAVGWRVDVRFAVLAKQIQRKITWPSSGPPFPLGIRHSSETATATKACISPKFPRPWRESSGD